MGNKQLWYMRRGMEVRGPYPAGQISRYILLGRIKQTDELSTDQHNWQAVAQVPVLIPEEMRTDIGDAQAAERLKIARMREDERGARDRRGPAENVPAAERRRASDRRGEEEEEVVRHREVKTAIAEAVHHKKQNYFLRGVLATLFLAAVIGAAWYYQPWQPPEETSDCNAWPQPWVNWNNCLMEGAQLAGADLRGARLRNASLAGADLRGAHLGGADLAYISLAGAKLWSAQLNQAALMGANLRNADVGSADLSGANLTYAVLKGADLTGANLAGADLTNADLQGAKIEDADFTAAKLAQAVWVDGSICPATAVGGCK